MGFLFPARLFGSVSLYLACFVTDIVDDILGLSADNYHAARWYIFAWLITATLNS